MAFSQKRFSSQSRKEVKRIQPIVNSILAKEKDYMALTDSQLKAKTAEFKNALAGGKTLDDILPDAFATVREAARRVLGMPHYEVQLIGGIVLHQGRIAEMKTGEGKTLVSTCPAYLNALTGNGVHIVTVNDYLAKRDADWMGKIHRFLGLTVGVILHDMKDKQRQDAYKCDITYVTNNELGFDYLRDNMAIYKEQQVLRGLKYAIVDEVDSVLIDEARTPLIISGQSEKSTKLYDMCDVFVQTLERGEFKGEMTKIKAIMQEEIEEDGDFVVNEKDKVVNLTEQGVHKVEKFFHLDNYSDPENLEIQHNVTLALRAHNLMERDKDYIVKDDEVLIVDEFTGRVMPGRRYSDGLHQAIEAKEHVTVKRESKTLATVTFQNFFNKFEKKSGMTGTAATEEKEFRDIYKLDVVEIPTNKEVIRRDDNDVVYKSKAGKYRAVIQSIRESMEKKQPVLIGTVTIETSEYLSKLLQADKIDHVVLNAKFHEQEAQIVAQAGKPGAVTIATNMAGRGTDIILGGNPEYLAKNDLKKAGYSDDVIAEATGEGDSEDEEVLEARKLFHAKEAEHAKVTKAEAEKVKAAGGLKIIGTERHESRRIDNQLRGRAGRQGDPGESRFYISLEDNLMRLFGQERLMGIFNALGVDEDTPIEHKMLSKAIERAQQKIEINNYGIRSRLLEYDQVMNEQREIMYKERGRVLDKGNMRSSFIKMIGDFIDQSVDRVVYTDGNPAEWNYSELDEIILPVIPMEPITQTEGVATKEDLKTLLRKRAKEAYENKEAEFATADDENNEQFREIERVVLLKVVDEKWMQHIDDMDQLKQGIGLQSFAQRDPVVEYKVMAYDMFDEMLASITEDAVKLLMHVQAQRPIDREEVAEVHGEAKSRGRVPGQEEASVKTFKREGKKYKPNDPCPCGSGKKFKNCHKNKEAELKKLLDHKKAEEKAAQEAKEAAVKPEEAKVDDTAVKAAEVKADEAAKAAGAKTDEAAKTAEVKADDTAAKAAEVKTDEAVKAAEAKADDVAAKADENK